MAATAWGGGGEIFSPRVFGGFVQSPGDFCGFDICIHSIILVTWNYEYSAGQQAHHKHSPFEAPTEASLPSIRPARYFHSCSPTTVFCNRTSTLSPALL